MLRVYVAASSREMDRARAAMTALRMHGVEVTVDWVAAIEAAGAANEGLSDEDRQRYAREDLDGVCVADVVWLLMPTTPTAGAYVELGYALARREVQDDSDCTRTPIVISGPGQERCIFAALADRCVATDADALAAVLAWAGTR